jgi:large subunit ribosomal protein L29
MKASNYREMSTDELANELETLKKRLFEVRSQSVTEKIENSKAMKNVKHDIARLKTIMQQRAAASTSGASQSQAE